MRRYNCFASSPRRCKILTVINCGSCSFFKTEAQQDADKASAHRRLAALDEAMQTHIAERYYRGKMPWQL